MRLFLHLPCKNAFYRKFYQPSSDAPNNYLGSRIWHVHHSCDKVKQKKIFLVKINLRPRFANKLRKAGRLLELVIIPGSKHASRKTLSFWTIYCCALISLFRLCNNFFPGTIILMRILLVEMIFNILIITMILTMIMRMHLLMMMLIIKITSTM